MYDRRLCSHKQARTWKRYPPRKSLLQTPEAHVIFLWFYLDSFYYPVHTAHSGNSLSEFNKAYLTQKNYLFRPKTIMTVLV